MAAMVGAIEQPWWADKHDVSKMKGKVCRETEMRTENMEARLHGPSDFKLKHNIDEIQLVLDKLIVKRTTKSRTIDRDDVLVKLPPHETRKTVCPLSEDQKKMFQDADQTIQDQAKAEHFTQPEIAKSQDHKIPQPSYGSYFSKAHKLRAATVIPIFSTFRSDII